MKVYQMENLLKGDQFSTELPKPWDGICQDEYKKWRIRYSNPIDTPGYIIDFVFNINLIQLLNRIVVPNKLGSPMMQKMIIVELVI